MGIEWSAELWKKGNWSVEDHRLAVDMRVIWLFRPVESRLDGGIELMIADLVQGETEVPYSLGGTNVVSGRI
jgi:hypothetical protein